MKAGDKVVVNKGNFKGQTATVVKAFKANHITNTSGIDVVALVLDSGTSLLLKQSHVEAPGTQSVAGLLDYGLHK